MSAKVPFVDLKAQYRSIEPEIKAALGAVLEKGDYILGSAVEAFEKDFAAFCRSRHAVSVDNGLNALRLALAALNVGPGDEVIVPASTYIATALAVSSLGAKPVLVDCDAGTFNIDAKAAERALSKRTKAVIPVHLAGQPADMDAIMALAKDADIPVVEDAAQAHGAAYRGKPAGSIGRLGCFSFYPGKNLGAYGDGGCVVTDDDALAERLRSLRNYGQKVKYEHVEKGLNARLDTLQAAVLSVKLKRLARWNEERARHAARYRELLAGIPGLDFQAPQAGAAHVYHLFYVETDRRDELRAHLKAAGVDTGIHYPKPVHLQPAYADLGLAPGALPNAERHARRTLSLPMFAELSQRQLDCVVGALKDFFAAKPAA